MRWTRLVPSPAMAVACLALLVALGGVGYAAVKLPANSVGTAQLKKDAVTGLKVKNGTLLAADFKRGQVVGAKGDPGPKGDVGPKGDQGPKGDTGDRGPSWGDVSGVGSGTGPLSNTLKQDGVGSLKLLVPGGGGKTSTQRYFVFGRVTVDMTCTSAGDCFKTCALGVSGNSVSGAIVSFRGKAGTSVSDDKSAFGVVTVSVRNGGIINLKPPTLTWYCSATRIATSSTGTYVGAIALGS